MLQEQSRFFQRLLFFADILLVGVGWVLAYFIRFELLTPPEWRPLEDYLQFVPWIAFVSAFGPRGALANALAPVGIEQVPTIYGFVGGAIVLVGIFVTSRARAT